MCIRDRPYLVNPETRLTLKPTECGLEGTDADYVIWDPAQGKPVVLEYPMNEGVTPPLFGTYEIDGKQYPTGGQLLKESVEAVSYTHLDVYKRQSRIIPPSRASSRRRRSAAACSRSSWI